MLSFARMAASAALLLLLCSRSFAEDKCSLSDISKFAADNCAAFAPGGSETTTSAKAGLDAGLSGLTKKFLGVDADGNAEVERKVKEYSGPVQAEVKEFAKDRETCREHFADKLIDLFCKKASEGEKPVVEATLCTGEYVGNCPGPHTLYLGCPNRTAADMIAMFCPSKRGSLTPIMTGISGNACGYSLLRLTCSN